MKELFETLMGVIQHYYIIATRAVKENDGQLYVPANLTSVELELILSHPECVDQQGENKKEPAYVSMDDANAGNNPS